MKKIALIALAAAAGTASAQFTFPTIGNTFVNNQWNAIQLDDSLVPAGLYVGYTITLDWFSNPEDPTANFSNTWSSEGRVAFATNAGSGTSTQPTYPGGTTIFSPTASLAGGASNS
jgi:hypothetical protein